MIGPTLRRHRRMTGAALTGIAVGAVLQLAALLRVLAWVGANGFQSVAAVLLCALLTLPLCAVLYRSVWRNPALYEGQPPSVAFVCGVLFGAFGPVLSVIVFSVGGDTWRRLAGMKG